MVYRITDKEFDALEFDLNAEIERFKQAREDHKTTEGVPAPTTHPLVENIVRRHNGEYEIAVTKAYIRVVDNVILDKKMMAVPPIDPEWVEATREDQKVSHYWDETEKAWLKPGVKEGRIAELERDRETLLQNLETVTNRLKRFESLEARLAALEQGSVGG